MAIKPKRSRRMLHSLMRLGNSAASVDVEAIPVFLPHLPEAFCGARVAVVADVHLPDAVLSVSRLIRCVALQRPDAVFLPGDLTNSYTAFDAAGLRRLASGLAGLAPCFAIPGNHELRLGREAEYEAVLTACGVICLNDSSAVWHHRGDTLRLFGMGHRRPRPLPNDGKPVIALAHKPDYFSYYRRARWDLVVCGHAHGGQVRLGGRGLYSPGQGLFPEYTDGLYREDGTTMVVSRGLGNSSVPWRVHNQAHLPVLLLFPE